MISGQALRDAFQQALSEEWGYIWGTRGQTQTQASQNKATRAMTVKYGAKWIGRRVADCSGLIKLAYQQHGGNGGVHPVESGYWQIAGAYWFFLKSFET